MINKIILLGRLGKDAELKSTAGGTSVLNANLATTERFKDKMGMTKETTDWHKLILFGKRAESLAKYLTKGKLIYVEGKSKTRSWDDKGGVKHYTTEIFVTEVVLCDTGKSDSLEKLMDEDEARKKSIDPMLNQMVSPFAEDDMPF